jgi:lipopolysaccharide export system permease protein
VSGIRLIDRYFVKELVANAIVSLLVVFAIFFLAALSLQVGKAHYDNLPMVVVLKYVVLLLLYTAYLTIPLSIVTTCIFTYGRASQDGEITAAQSSGIPLMRLLLPAHFLGACAMLVLSVLQNRVMPEAHFQSRQVDESVFLNFEQILKRKDREIKDRSFLFKWRAVAEDAAGNLVLDDIELVQYRDKKPASWSMAKRARPVVEPGSSRVTLELVDAHRAEEGAAMWCGRVEIPIDLSALTAPGQRGLSDLSYEELLSGTASARSERRRLGLAAEFHFRLAMAISALLLGALAAPLGIAFRIRNRAVVFLAGVLIMTAGYLPLVIVAKTVAERGMVPAWISLQVPNLLLLGAAIALSRKARRT